jgi:hypothetical protein
MAESTKAPIRGKHKKSDGEKTTATFDQDQYEAHKSAIAIIMSHFFLRYLNLLYREFEGDIVLPMVLGEIAMHNICRFYSPKSSSIEVHEQMTNFAERLKNLEPSNAFSISEATGIPRETVRRKIDKLEKKGWIVKHGRGEVFISETVVAHFTKDLSRSILAELLETSDCVRNYLQD